MDINIQELSITDDFQQYILLLKQLTTVDPDKITQEDFINQLQLIKSNPFHKIYVAKINNKIVGTTTIFIEPKIIHNISRVAHIEDVVVDFEYRSRGIGSLLMDKVITISKEFKCYKIILDCSSKNIEYYKRFGFIEKEHQMALYLDN